MSKADEFFKSLGYKLLDNLDKDYDNKYIVYIKKEKTIKFKKENHKVGINDQQRNYINIQELQAINEKVKELRLDRRRR